MSGRVVAGRRLDKDDVVRLRVSRIVVFRVGIASVVIVVFGVRIIAVVIVVSGGRAVDRFE